MTMKTMTLILASALAVGSLLSAPVLAQRGPAWRGGGGWGMHGPYGRMYDPKTVETIKGEIVAVETFTPMQGMRGGVHLKLKTDKEVISVHLGPSWYIENQDTKLEVKNTIEVKGSRIVIAGKPAIVAAEIKKGDETLKLRDDAGIPYWAGWRHAATAK